jgi:hypothetical protein
MSIIFPEIRSYAFNHKSEIISILLWGKIAGQWVFLFPLINDLPIAQWSYRHNPVDIISDSYAFIIQNSVENGNIWLL